MAVGRNRASFLPRIRLVVADIFVKHCNLLFVIVLFPISVLHGVFLSCLNHQMRELQNDFVVKVLALICNKFINAEMIDRFLLCGEAIRHFHHCH